MKHNYSVGLSERLKNLAGFGGLYAAPGNSRKYVGIITLLFSFLLITSNAFGQCGAGTFSGNSWQICFQGNTTTTSYSLGTIVAPGYARLAVVRGFTYRFTTCGIGFDSQLTIKDDADNNLAYNDDGGTDCSGNNASVDWTATYTGYVRVNMHRYNCTSGGTGTVNVKVVGGSNTQDDQNAYGNGNWIGHVYDGAGSGGAGAFATYTGYYTESEQFNQSFGGSTGCLQLLSNNQPNVQMYAESFSIRYRMIKNFDCGLYTFTIGSDDGARLFVNGVNVVDRWADQGYSTTNSVSLYLNGPTYMVLEYYEAGSGNQVSFSYTKSDVPIVAGLTKIDPTACGSNGTINIAPSAGSAVLWYNDDFLSNSPAAGTQAKFGNAGITGGYLRLTDNVNSQQGTLVVNNPNAFNSGQVRAEFDLYTGNGTNPPADGFSISYADDIPASPTGNELGLGTKLQIRFRSYTGGTCPQAISIWYAGAQIGTCYGATNLWRGDWRRVIVNINASNQITLTVGATTYVTNANLPPGYAAADKSSWKWAFSARTGGSNDRHWIDNVTINGYSQYEYSTDATNWVGTTGLTRAAGTYTVYVRNKGGGCQTNLGIITLNNPIVPEPSGSNVNDCTNASTATISATPPSGATIDWYNAPIGGSIISGGTGTNSVTVAPGTYYAQARHLTNNCVSSTRKAITLTINPVPSAPTSGGNVTICTGSGNLVATPPSGCTVDWYNSSSVLVASGTNTYTTSIAGTYGAVARNTTTGCLSTTATSVILTVTNNPSVAPLSVSGTNEICVGGSTTLTTVSGSLGTNAVDVWYAGGCANEAFSQDWGSQPYGLGSTTVNSVSGGILSVTSTSNDPMIMMGGLGSFNPATYRYVNIRYRVTAGTAGNVEIFFYNTAHNFAVGGETGFGTLVSDGNWNTVSVDMWTDPDYLTGGNILGWRYDWATAPGVTMELDFITLSDRPIIGTGTTLTVSPTSTTTYFTAKKGLCNVTSCASRTVTVNADPTVSISGAANVCAGQTVTLTANVSGGSGSVTGYQWRRNSGNIATGNPYTTSNALSAGSYSYDVSVTQSGSGCASTFSTTVSANVNALPTPSIAVAETSGTTNNDGTTCSGATVTLTASGGSTYSWNIGLGTGNPKTPAPSGTTTYGVTATDGNNCSATAQRIITVNSNPSASASASTPLCEGGTINFSAGGGSTYSWSGPVAYSAAGASPTRTGATLAMAGTYQVTVTDGNNCSASTTTNAVVINANPTGSVSYESCAGVNGQTTIKISGSGGTAPYNFRLLPGSFGVSNTFAINNGSTNNFFEVRDNANCTSNTITHNATHGTPTVIATNTTTATACSCNGENRDVYLSSGNNLVAIINDNGNNLGTVNATIYNQFSAVVVNGEAAMNKSWTLGSSLQPNTNVSLRLPFTNASYTNLVTEAANTTTLTDDISTISDIGATRYSGPNEDGVYDASSGTATFLTQLNNGSIFGGSYVSFSSSGFSEWWLHGSLYGVGLPVELISFTATAINNEYIRLDWATALEINNDGFEIERSTDAQNWTNIAWIDGNDNSTTTKFYSHNDVQVAQSITYYYRLKQLDNDGQFEYSNIVNATLTGSSNGFDVLDFIPNPTVDQTTLLISSGAAQEITVSFYNAIGQEVQTNTHELSEGMNQITFDVNLLAAGTYMATVTSGNEVRTKRLVIAK